MIRIATRLRPFSHMPGIECLIPGTSQVVRVFPTQIQGKEQMELPVQGPVRQFTVEQNLERGHIEISSKKFRLFLTGDGLTDKKPAPFLEEGERLCLGCHKKQEWENVVRRGDLREFLPFWFRLGSVTPKGPPMGGQSMLDQCRQIIEVRGRVEIGPAFVDLFQVGFQGMLVPYAEDQGHRGYPLPPIPEGADPLQLLTEGARLIRSLFIHEEKRIEILPCLPVELHAGRLCNVQCSLGTLQIEWAKKQVRRVILEANKSAQAHFVFQKPLRSFRLRKKERLDVGTPFAVSKGEKVLLDRFEK